MFSPTGISKALVFSLILTAGLAAPTLAQQKKQRPTAVGTPVLWRDPGNVSARNLRYGPGSAELAPTPPFTFVKEDKIGASPKIQVTDSRGVRWVVKFGIESQAETVATRLVWAMGYFAEEAYYLDRAEIKIFRASRAGRSMWRAGQLYAACGLNRGAPVSCAGRRGTGCKIRSSERAIWTG